MKFTLTGAVCFRLFAIVSLLCLGRLCTGKEPACTILAGEDVSQPFRELLPENGRGFLFLKSGEIDRILGELNLRRDELLKQNTLTVMLRWRWFQALVRQRQISPRKMRHARHQTTKKRSQSTKMTKKMNV